MYNPIYSLSPFFRAEEIVLNHAKVAEYYSKISILLIKCRIEFLRNRKIRDYARRIMIERVILMPIKVPDNLPAKEILTAENIFVMNESRAFKQDIRPLKILILNLMPNKQETEVQLLRLIGNTPLQVEVTLMYMESHTSKNTSMVHLSSFYNVFGDIEHKKFDGMIITGAPIEHLPFEELTYWPELVKIMEWTKTNVTNTLHICWGAQAGLHYHYGIPKYPLDQKAFGIFEHQKIDKNCSLLRGFDDLFYVPHSRHTTIHREDIEKNQDISIVSESEESGVYLVVSKDGRQVFATGHSEYDPGTLKKEYLRDVNMGLAIDMPLHYFQDDDPSKEPLVRWRSHSNLLFHNWLNYYVYQETPYDLDELL